MSSISGVNGVASAYAEYSTTAKKNVNEEVKEAESTKDAGVVYEKSSEAASTDRSAIVAQLKAAQDSYQQQLQSIVKTMMGQQANAFGAATDMWKFLASGNFTVDAATKAQAQKDIAEDGYWGVEQTSDRILDFAKALSGGDKEKASELLDAFKKGYKEATGEWGKDLPDISSKTYDAVLDKFDKWMNEDKENKENEQVNPENVLA